MVQIMDLIGKDSDVAQTRVEVLNDLLSKI
jgi:hypothetical protein